MKKNFSKVLAILFATMLVFTLAACGEKKDPDAGKGKTEELGDWKHENRGLITNLGAAASTTNPFGHANVVDRGWILNAFEPLFCYNGLTGENEPRVGKEYSISDDGITYRVKIFDNVYFQNGKHVTAEDIKSSYEFAKTSAFNTQFSGAVDKVEVVDEYTVDIILKEPSAPFLSNSDQIFILDVEEATKQGEAFGTIPNQAGTGAYYIAEYDQAVEIKLVRHEKFHRSLEGKRAIPDITFKIMTDPSAVVLAFESGALDFISVQPSSFKAIEDGGKHNTHIGQTTQSVYYVLNTHNNDPLSDKELRKAIAYAVDYESVLLAGQSGYGEVTGKFAHPEFTIAAPESGSGTVYSYDPAKAKEHLAAYGQTAVDIGKLMCISGSAHEKMALVIQENLADVGITVELDPREQVTAISDMRAGNFQSGVMGYYMMMDYDYFTGIVDFDGNSQSIVKMEGATDYDYERIYELFAEGRRHTDENKRREIYTELDEILTEAAVLVPLLHTALTYAWDKDLYIELNKPYTYHYTQFWNCYWE